MPAPPSMPQAAAIRGRGRFIGAMLLLAAFGLWEEDKIA